ncbi:MAG: orotate phosphoribosyltransferase [Clostridia bacterium]|nr:orotate phosphoribosyltransferase [Clostridia bacterium]
MPTNQIFKYETKRSNLYLRVAKGHFATAHSHSNYYIDVVAQKARASEAKAVAEELSSYFNSSTIIDSILCLDGTEVIGAFLAEELTKADFLNLNAHKSMYVVTPETTNAGQLLFRDNIVPMIANKNVLILAVSVASGKTVESAIEAITYYGGKVSGIASIFSTAENCGGFPVHSVFNPEDLQDYGNYPARECPLCKAGVKIDALINSHGFSKL